MERVYLDHGASMPVDKRIEEAILKHMTENFGNPFSLHKEGRASKRSVEEARENVAKLISAEDKASVIFTASATESNNLAIRGVAHRNKNKGNHIITSAIEHMSVINPLKDLQKEGFEVTFLPVDKDGLLDPEKVKEAITDKTILISIMYANGEIGTMEPVREIGEIAKDKDIYFHSDCVAAEGQIPIDVERDNIDLLSLSSNDLYGPKGVGGLYIKKGVKIQPIMYGGGQERGLRSGTENVYSIFGMGLAAKITKDDMEKDSQRLKRLRDKLIQGVLDNIDEAYLTGHRTKRLPHHASFRFDYIEGESIILNLDMEGISASTGSACSSKTLEPSHVLIALGLKHEQAHGSLVLTLGRQNTDDHVNRALEVIPTTVQRLREMSPLYKKK
ncbi:MAG: cysteine desulfurase [Thermoplasmata archaeon]|nr:MAG: cysteine desulfurase [Thermoplasmata archaeon]